MSYTDKSLPALGDKYLVEFDAVAKSLQLRRRSRANGNLNVKQAMDLVENLVRRYESSYWTHQFDKTLIQLPYLLSRPPVGAKIKNLSTGEIYTIKQVFNTQRGIWAGHLKLELNNAPSYEKGESLEFEDKTLYVRLVHNFVVEPANKLTANLDGNLSDIPPMMPTIGWSLVRKEPGATHGPPFSPSKELNSRLRESTKDSQVMGYTVQILGQAFDNIVQFDCYAKDIATSDRLADWLESFFKFYTWFLRGQGVGHILFWNRQRDLTAQNWRQSVALNTVQYYFRTEQLETVWERDLLKLDVNIGVTGLDIPDRDGIGPRYIADQLVSGELVGDAYRNLFYDQSGNYLFGDINILQ